MATQDTSTALGFFELNSISRGLMLTDVVVKKAPVEILASEAVSNGKYALLFSGDIASVEESFQEAQRQAEGTVIRDVFIPSVHPQLLPFLEVGLKGIPTAKGFSKVGKPLLDSIGIVESASMAEAVLSCDRALKATPVVLSKIQLGTGIGGKAFYILSGNLEDIQASLEVAVESLKAHDALIRSDCIPRPQEEARAFY